MALKTLFTFPGKIGDCFNQWPIAYQWSKERHQQIDVGISDYLVPVKTLLESQKCVDRVLVVGRMVDYFDTNYVRYLDLQPGGDYASVYNFGFRRFPRRQVTLDQRQHVPDLELSDERLAEEPSIFVEPKGVPSNACVVHSNSIEWSVKVLAPLLSLLRERFEVLYWVSPDQPLPEGFEKFEDGGNFLELARLIARCRMTLGPTSAVVPLAGAMKIPCINVNFGDRSLPVFHNLGPNQLNLTCVLDDVKSEVEKFIEERAWTRSEKP